MLAQRVLIRRPSSRLAEGIVTHIERSPVDVDLALRQWHGYVSMIEQAGWESIEVRPIDECPDSVFVEDTVVVYGNVAVIARSAALTRRPETEATETMLRSLGFEVHCITDPGTLDGGDVLKVRNVVYVAKSTRTNDAGIQQLTSVFERLGARVKSVSLRDALHLKSAVTALPDGSIIGYPPLVDDPSEFERFIEVPEESGAHVVLLGGTRLLVASNCPQSVRLFERLGYQCSIVDISEFQKLEGCVTCLSVLLPFISE